MVESEFRVRVNFFYHKIQITIKQDSGEEAQKETIRLIDIGFPQSKKNKVNSNNKARIDSKTQWRQV